MATPAELAEFARTLAVAASPPELCLFNWQWTCMPRSDWAAWVQAVGAIAAIGVAIYISRRESAAQKHRDLIAQQDRSRETVFAELAQFQQVHRLAVDVRTMFNRALESGSYGLPLTLPMNDVSDIRSRLRALEVVPIGDDVRGHIVAIRSILAHTLQDATAYSEERHREVALEGRKRDAAALTESTLTAYLKLASQRQREGFHFVTSVD